MNGTNPEIHYSLLKRKIIHIDLDAFFAAVESRNNPKLKGKPLIIGGSPSSRGVVCTASYEARKFGIKSAMASSQALKLCPHAIFLKPNFESYKNASREVFKILSTYSELIEPMSMDEAYIDVSESKNATEIAENIRKKIQNLTQLTASAGIAPNKMVAKIASDINKPNGIAIVKPHQVFNFMQPLLIKKIPFVGPVTTKKFADFNIYTCADVILAGKDFIINKFGSSSEWVYQRACGIDESPLETTQIRKSLGEEETFPKDIFRMEHKLFELNRIILNLFININKKNLAAKTITVKIKYANFTVKTKSKSYPLYFFEEEIIKKIALELFLEFKCDKEPLRLIGVSISNLIDKSEMKQTTLFDNYI
ncbi:DNA polymerase IV [Fluviispira multicolorata]|uniref:DNA polymerase IV n=1 Tax=Fluviispira multicolorata TaxID=2654512 RepID=A0A833JAR3_9BACT|nr:DNA polymerase IV [Fluviispira multicolorata]KAB8028116.1 DNA polymerase IV [Fluviispira multicolorata]